jgi:hypothetical protein
MLNKKLLGSVSAGPAEYVEDVFSTYLYTGNGTFSGETQAISNGIDLAGEGGMVWIKNRTSASTDNCVSDTVRGGTSNMIRTNSTATATGSGSNISFQSTGFTCLTSGLNTNYTGENYCSWTFRKTKKFFDIVTWTGTGSAMTINHNLGSAPGMIIMKKVNGSPGTGNWAVWHRGLPTESGSQQYESNVLLNLTDANVAYGYLTATPTSSSFSVSSSFGQASDYVAYLFAHDAGGFGTAGTDNIISCGSFTTATSTLDVSLGYEPQWLMIKRVDSTGSWQVYDNMRGMTSDGSRRLYPNLSNAEDNGNGIQLLANGFNINTTYNATFIYMAIRRPMKTPTSGTEVFVTDAAGANASANGEVFSSSFPVDFHFRKERSSSGNNWFSNSRLISGSSLTLNTTNAESSLAYVDKYDRMSGIATTTGFDYTDWAGWLFKRAPGFFDIVCYTGTGSATTVTHNLTVAPELMMIKQRSSAGESWQVYSAAIGNTKYLSLNTDSAQVTSSTRWNNTSPTSSVFTLGTGTGVNGSGSTYVAYLFATVAGVSKVGSYTGNGSTQTINCGFTAGARFILIKRTDDTGDWYVYDTARGIVSGNDPQLKLNSTAAEATGYDAIDPDNSGFIVNNDATNFPINVNNATYIFLAIA